MIRSTTFVTIAALALGLALGLPPGQGADSAAADGQQVILSLEGMTCASCAFAIKAALKKLDGVQETKVSYREKNAVVTYDPARVTIEKMVSAVDKAGFEAIPPDTDAHQATEKE